MILNLSEYLLPEGSIFHSAILPRARIRLLTRKAVDQNEVSIKVAAFSYLKPRRSRPFYRPSNLHWICSKEIRVISWSVTSRKIAFKSDSGFLYERYTYYRFVVHVSILGQNTESIKGSNSLRIGTFFGARLSASLGPSWILKHAASPENGSKREDSVNDIKANRSDVSIRFASTCWWNISLYLRERELFWPFVFVRFESIVGGFILEISIITTFLLAFLLEEFTFWLVRMKRSFFQK